MTEPVKPIVLVAATLLAIPTRRIRALARGDEGAVRDWIANESSTRLAEARRDARIVMQRIAEVDARIVLVTDSDYPAGLLDLADPPPFLIVRGLLPPSARGGLGTAVVGSRTPSDAGVAATAALVTTVTPPIVSGLAPGIDAAVHRAALAAGLAQVAYVGHGLGRPESAELGELADAVVAAGGAVASEYLPGEPATPWSRRRRDRLQAAHAHEVVLVESEPDGGAFTTLRDAQRLGRAIRRLDRPEA